MAHWINAKDRKPDKYGRYFVLMNTTLDVYSYFEFDRRMQRMQDDDVLVWLDESTGMIPHAVSYQLCDPHGIHRQRVAVAKNGRPVNKRRR